MPCHLGQRLFRATRIATMARMSSRGAIGPIWGSGFMRRSSRGGHAGNLTPAMWDFSLRCFLAGLSPPPSSCGVAEYSFKSSAFFGGKMNVRSSVVHVARSSSGADTASSAAAGKEEAKTLAAAMSPQHTLLAQYAVDATRYG